MTIELTKERLEEIADEHMRVIYPQEVGQMARELLTLRSRDAGDDLHQHLREKDAEIERLRVQLSGCLTAAEGHFPDPPVCKGDYAWTPAYQKTLNLRRERDTLNAEVERLKGYIAVLNGGGPPNE